MREIKAKKAEVHTCSPYGAFERLTDSECFAGDGWECWMTEGLCMSHEARVTACHSDSVQPYELEAMTRTMDSQRLLICTEHSMIVAVAEETENIPQTEKVEAFVLEPGEIFLIRPGIWYDICRGTEKPVDYYILGKTGEDPDSFIPLDNGAVKVTWNK